MCSDCVFRLCVPAVCSDCVLVSAHMHYATCVHTGDADSIIKTSAHTCYILYTLCVCVYYIICHTVLLTVLSAHMHNMPLVCTLVMPIPASKYLLKHVKLCIHNVRACVCMCVCARAGVCVRARACVCWCWQ